MRFYRWNARLKDKGTARVDLKKGSLFFLKGIPLSVLKKCPTHENEAGIFLCTLIQE